jgi:DNA processing protein
VAPERRLRPPQTDAERVGWLRLIRADGVGPLTFARIAERFSGVRAALDALPDFGRRPMRPASEERAAAELEAAARAGARLVCLGEPDYPPLLAAIADPPPAFWALGDVALAQRPCVAVVGARNASAAGQRLAAMLAHDLGRAGWTVVSGLARGIDRAAHEAALPTGTAAVMAGGADVVYPPEHRALHARIAAEGLVLSEAAMGEEPAARSFPRRNRIVSGLSAGVVLIEAAERSGSLITARFAAEQGREAMAVPGSPLDPRAAGCNALIREGAALIRSAEDVAEALRRPAPFARRAPPPPVPEPGPDAPDAERVAALLGPSPVAFDDLAAAAGLPVSALAAALTELEIAGRIDRRPGDLIALAPGA